MMLACEFPTGTVPFYEGLISLRRFADCDIVMQVTL